MIGRRRSWGQIEAGDNNNGNGNGNVANFGNRQRKRRRNDSDAVPLPLEDKLESLIVRIGDRSNASLEKNIEDLAQVLNEDSLRYKANIIRIISECVAEVPEKCGVYAALVGQLNVINYSLAGEIVEAIVTHFKECLKTSQFEKGRSIVRFFGDLVNCHVISVNSYLNLLESLVNVTLEIAIPQARADFFVFTVLSTLPWAARELHEKKEKELDQLLAQIEAYMGKRAKPHHTALRVWYSDNPHPQEEYLECLWTQISKLRADKWIERQIFRPYGAFAGQFSEALQTNLPHIQIPPHEPNYVYPYPKVTFRLFDYNDCPEGPAVMPSLHSIERFIVEEHCQFLLNQNSYDRKHCAYSLIQIPNAHTIPVEYVVAETILSNLFALPGMKHLDVFYGSLLLELCKINPNTFPQVLAHAVELLYERLDSMNVACVDRFVNWFAYHLSNFQFRWSWEDWSQCLNMDQLQPKAKFVRETFLKCMRLSYHQRVIEIAPSAFMPLMPEEPLPVNKYATETGEATVEFETVKELMVSFKEKATPEVVMEILNKLDEFQTPSANGFSPLKINVFLTVLLNYASKSFTHLFFMIAKYNKVLHQLNVNDDAQICILKTIFEVWKSHQQLIEVLITKLLKAGIVSYTSVANFIFSKEMHGELMKSYVWDILHATIRRQIKTVNNLEKELNDLRDPNKKAEFISKKAEALADGDVDMDAAEPESLEDKIEQLEEKFENGQSEQKNLFLIIFQRFIELLSEHIQSCEQKGKSFKNHWFRWSIGRLQQIFYEHHENIFLYIGTLESLLFTSDLDQHILLIFKQFSSLRA